MCDLTVGVTPQQEGVSDPYSVVYVQIKLDSTDFVSEFEDGDLGSDQLRSLYVRESVEELLNETEYIHSIIPLVHWCCLDDQTEVSITVPAAETT